MEKTDISSSAPIGFLRLSSTLSMCILAPRIYPWESIIIYYTNFMEIWEGRKVTRHKTG